MMATDTSPTIDKPNRNHRLQYSLRSLLVIVLLVSVGLSWFTVKRGQAKRQHDAVVALRRLGGFVLYDYEHDGHGHRLPTPTPPGPDWLRDWLGVDFLSKVAFVAIGHSPHGDVELAILRNLPDLEVLWVGWIHVTDAGLEHIEGLTKLKMLSLWKGVRISDAGLEHLKALNQLRELLYGSDRITNEGIRKLQQALPDCKVERIP